MPDFQRRITVTLHLLEGQNGENFFVLPTERELNWEREQIQQRLRTIGGLSPEASSSRIQQWKELAQKLREHGEKLPKQSAVQEESLSEVLKETAQTLEVLVELQNRSQEVMARYEEKRAKVELLRAEATPLTFSLRIPTYAEYLEAREQATRVDYDTGRVDFDPVKMIRYLLPRCVEGHSEKEVMDLPPQIADKLAQHLSMAINPGEDEINFLYSSCLKCNRDG